MKELHTEIEIAASPQTVWQILTKFGRYPEWNPFIRSIVGDLEVGAKLRVHVGEPGAKGMKFKPRVLVVEPERELRWAGTLLFSALFRGEHYLRIEPLGEGRVRFVHGERFSGLLLPLAWRGLNTKTRAGFERMNEALKEEAEPG